MTGEPFRRKESLSLSPLKACPPGTGRQPALRLGVGALSFSVLAPGVRLPAGVGLACPSGDRKGSASAWAERAGLTVGRPAMPREDWTSRVTCPVVR